MIVEEALRRQQVYNNLEKHLGTIKRLARRLDAEAEVYVFGSVAEGRHTYASDIDVLILTDVAAGKVHLELWRAGIRDPFEIHVQPPRRIDLYRRKGRLIHI